MKQSHIFDPAHIAVLESEDRKMWQNPDRILRAVDLQSSWVAVDLGSGSGYFTVPLSRAVRKVLALDVQQEMLDFLRAKLQRLRIANVELRLSKPDKIPVEENSVDFLMSVNTLHEFGDRDKMIGEMWRILKRCAKLLIVDFKKEDTGFGPPVSIRVTKERAVRLFEKKGFKLSKATELPYHYLLVFVKG
jgi:ubiquinone/menaquinone biosynthesis C-methylase UbiE